MGRWQEYQASLRINSVLCRKSKWPCYPGLLCCRIYRLISAKDQSQDKGQFGPQQQRLAD